MTNPPKIALVYDWADTAFGGAERVLMALHAAFPQAPLFTSIYCPRSARWARDFVVIPSWLQKIQFKCQLRKWLVWLMPIAFESFSLDSFEIVISVTSAAAKGVLTKPHQLHLCYLLTPPRFVYQSQKILFAAHPWLKLPLVSQLATLALKSFAQWDKIAITRPDVIVPISRRVSLQTQKNYSLKTSQPIYLPVENSFFSTSLSTSHSPPTSESYVLLISRLVPYKNIDQAIIACETMGQKLVVIGSGSDWAYLNSFKKTKTEFLGQVTNEQRLKYMQNSMCVLIPGEEDFGIVALEANALGKPVIIHHASGAAELITDSLHGVHLTTGSSQEIIIAIQKIRQHQWDPMVLRKNVEKYDTTSFVRQFRMTIDQYWQLSTPSVEQLA